jgi:hypothetical protein
MTRELTAMKMARSLAFQAKMHDVSLNGLTIDNFNSFLDDLFNDGGEIRCEKFIDLADSYALKFGKLESKEFDNAKWPCIEDAIKFIQEKYL